MNINPARTVSGWVTFPFLFGLGLLAISAVAGVAGEPPGTEIRILEIQGLAELSPSNAVTWVVTQTNQVLHPADRLRTGPNSRVVLRWSDQSVVPFGALSEIEILPPDAPGNQAGLHLFRGILSFFHRDKPGRIRVLTSGGTAGIEGTEFVLSVDQVTGSERTTLSVIDGRVSLTNASGGLSLTNGQQAEAQPGRAPQRTAGFIANNLLQWSFYYPAVLDLAELPLEPADQSALAGSLAAYRQGDLLTALARYPEAQAPGSTAARLYHAALLLAVGQAEAAEQQLARLTSSGASDRENRLAGALRVLMAAVRQQPNPTTVAPELASEFLAASYFEQARAGGEKSLTEALRLARQATASAPEFSFAWERVAELEFSFGHTAAAQAALRTSLKLAPRNAEAISLHGFLLAAENRTREALAEFNQALSVDSALGNAWLGRGLCLLRGGDAGGREDLLVAAAVEPQRSLLRSYLGKAYANAGDRALAREELRRARELDPADPTPWLYAALLDELENRINAGIRDLEKSESLGNNRGIYRSQLLLDQDRAVRGANLARVYEEAGLGEVASREAGQAVADDYTSYSTHLFLANSFAQFRNSTPYGVRYETPALSEFLIAALLGPPDPRLLAQSVSQQEYTRLLDRDGLGLVSQTEYLSRGAWNQYGAQFGTFDGTSYALEGSYQTDPGQAPNAGFDKSSLSAKIKQQITPTDSVLLQVSEYKLTGGDLAQHYDPAATIQGETLKEKQAPDLLLGYHHEWSPENHTLMLFNHIDDQVSNYNPAGFAALEVEIFGSPQFSVPTDVTRAFTRHYVANSFELQQIQRFGEHQILLGARFQEISQHISNQDEVGVDNLSGGTYSFEYPYTPYDFQQESVNVNSLRASLYAYDYWKIDDQLKLFGGLSGDRLQLADNTSAPPLNSDRVWKSHLSPKVVLLWQPCREASLVAGYAQSVTGQDLDQSLTLEPTHLFGLASTFRTAFPDSLVGGLSGERMEVWQVDARLRFSRNLYAVVGATQIRSKDDTTAGSYIGNFPRDPTQPESAQVRDSLRFKEQSLHASLRQLVGENLSLGTRYEVAKADLSQDYAITDAPFSINNHGVLHTWNLSALAYTRTGLFAGAEANWYYQTDLKDSILGGPLPDGNFWQLNASMGYRSPHRRFECTLGCLNLTGQNYLLSPINLYQNLPRSRTLAISTRFSF